MNKLPIFEAKINGETEGILAIALVDFPAVESNFLVFNKIEEKKETLKFSIKDEDQHIITGVVMRADFPIYRYDKDFGEYYIFYSADTIKTMAEKMMTDKTFNEINIMHNDNEYVDGVNIVELFIKDKSKGIDPTGFEDIEEGSLFATYKVNNEEIWSAIKSGEFAGFSLQGYFTIEESDKFNYKKQETKNYKNTIINKMNKFMEKLLKSFIHCGSMTTEDGKEFYWVGEADLQIGDELFYNTETEEAVKVEDGEYKLEDGTTVVVVDGLVSEIREADGENEDSLDNEVEAEEEKKDEACEEENPEQEPEKEPETDPMQEKIEALEAQVEDLMIQVEDLKETLNTLLNEPAAEPIAEEYKKVSKQEDNGIPAFGSKAKRFH